MDSNVEQEICNNCKKEIPQANYVMHTMHCARNITLCKFCKEPIPKAQFSNHEKICRKPVQPKPLPPPSNIEKSSYYQTRKAIEDKKVEARKERYNQKMDRLVDSGYSLTGSSTGYRREGSVDCNRDSPTNYRRDNSNNYGRESPGNFGREMSNNYARESSVNSSYRSRLSNNYNTTTANEIKENGLSNSRKQEIQKEESKMEKNAKAVASPLPPLIKRSEPKSSGMLACKYCDLELPKLDLEEHENYCGSRTDKCLECGELVRFKDKQVHMDSTHAGAKRRGGQTIAGWDSSTQRNESSSNVRERPSRAIRPLGEFDYDPMPYLPSAYQAPGGGAKKKEGETYKEISRRLDSLTFTGPAPQPPTYRRRNPPTELVIPCEFCNVPIPHEELIQHETGCRPDLARFNPRRRSSPEDDYYSEPPTQTSVDEEDLPCEFCGDMIPASQLYSHQIRCT